MSDYIRADTWIGFCDLIDEFGGDSKAVLAASNISPDDLVPVDRYLPMSRFIAMLNHAVESTGRLDFGLQFGTRRRLTQVGVVGLAMQNGVNWRSIIDIGVKVGRIANPLVTARLEACEAPDAYFLWMDDTGCPLPDREQGVERTVAFTISTARSLVRPDFKPLAVQFEHDQIAGLDAYEAVLGVTPTFGHRRTGLIISADDIDRPIASADPAVGSVAMAYLESQNLIEAGDLVRAARLTARSLVELRETSAENLAAALGVEVRTLQRKLKDGGTTIETAFDDARRALAERLLTDNVHSLEQIAELLGYGNASTLTRNCKRWFGLTPAKARIALADKRA